MTGYIIGASLLFIGIMWSLYLGHGWRIAAWVADRRLDREIRRRSR